METMYDWVAEQVDKDIVPMIEDFIRIPNQSRLFDPEWNTNGLQQKACNFCIDWALKLGIKGLKLELVEDEGKTPLVLGVVDVPDKPTVLMYGHIDKQPPLTEDWDEGLHPHKPVIRDGKLYGRGAADDGYAFFASMLMVRALQKHNIQHNRIVFFFETDEESGSRDLLYYLQKFKDTVKEPSLVICLDSGCCDYEHLCLTTTLRGNVVFTVKAEVTYEGVHSGDASGMIPDSYRVLNEMLSRFENPKTGRLPSEFYVNVPSDKYEQAYSMIKQFNGKVDFKFPFLQGVQPMEEDGFKQYMNRIWSPTLTYIGMQGMPSLNQAGNVLRKSTTLRMSLRIPPSLNKVKAKEQVEAFFAKQKPINNAKVTVTVDKFGQGFVAPPYSQELKKAISEASNEFFGKEAIYYGEGGSIPFINDLATLFPKSQFIVTGTLGPESNAHGPNEMLNLPYMKKLILSLTKVLAEYAKLN